MNKLYLMILLLSSLPGLTMDNDSCSVDMGIDGFETEVLLEKYKFAVLGLQEKKKTIDLSRLTHFAFDYAGSAFNRVINFIYPNEDLLAKDITDLQEDVKNIGQALFKRKEELKTLPKNEREYIMILASLGSNFPLAHELSDEGNWKSEYSGCCPICRAPWNDQDEIGNENGPLVFTYCCKKIYHELCIGEQRTSTKHYKQNCAHCSNKIEIAMNLYWLFFNQYDTQY